MSDPKQNSSLWNATRFTDPNKTKKTKLPGGFNATTVDANWVLERATELFGPCGQGFGWQIISAFETQNQGLATVHIRFWYIFDGQRGEYDAIASNETDKSFKSGDTIADSDAFKKALTDAVKNALTKIGFLADIHQGRHDDPRYLAQADAYARSQAEKAKAQEQAEDKPAEQQEAKRELTGQQQANALFIALKRRDAAAAEAIVAQHGGTDEESKELARALGKLLYRDLAATDEQAAKDLIGGAAKADDGRVADPVALVAKFQEAIRSQKGRAA